MILIRDAQGEATCNETYCSKLAASLSGTLRVGRGGRTASNNPEDGEASPEDETRSHGESELEETEKAEPRRASRRQTQKRKPETTLETDVESGSQEEDMEVEETASRRKRNVS